MNFLYKISCFMLPLMLIGIFIYAIIIASLAKSHQLNDMHIVCFFVYIVFCVILVLISDKHDREELKNN